MRLARELDRIQPTYDAIVVGSGYGAGVAASRLARMGLSVAVLERGREFAIGEFPDTLPEALQEFQYRFEGVRHGKRTGLFDLRYGRDMHVLVGCGLGGTSLINANVSLAPEPRVWEDPRWPPELLADDTLEEGFARARRMLRPVPYPENVPLDKLARMGEAAEALGAKLSRPPINVVFETGANAAGVVQPACTLCGDCCSGCNVGSKTTVQMTYLPDAANHGAEIFTDATVRYLRKEDDGWRVFYTPTSQRRDGFRSPERSVSARLVVLGAGSLGSTEILLRSREHGLAVSERLGDGFTGNGDVLAFAYNGERPVNAVGVGVPPRADLTPGPCITGAIDLRDAAALQDGMIIEEGVLPSGLAEILPATFHAAGRLFGKDTDSAYLDEFQEAARRMQSSLLGPWRGAMHNTSTFLVMAHDDGRGRLALEDGHLRLHWPDVARQQVFQRIEDKLLQASAANGATYIRNPIQNTFLGKNLITVHPLGGCGMGRDATQGVVDHACRVYDTSAGATAVHDGLYVCDGAVIPRPVGVNPLLTITALAERAMLHAARGLGRTFTDAPKSDAPQRVLPPPASVSRVGLAGIARSLRHYDLLKVGSDLLATLKVGVTGERGDATPSLDTGADLAIAGVEFTERMAGFISDQGGADYAAAAAAGKAAGNTFSFTVTVRIADVDRFIRDPAHAGTLTGTADCPALSPEPLDISNGVFRLMHRSEEQVETRLFEYLMTLSARDGRSYNFKGVKYVHDDRRLDLVADTTTLFVELVEGAGGDNRARGVLKILPADFARQVRTLKGIGGRSALERANAVAKFGALFAGQLFDIYGDIFAPVRRYNPNRVRKKRGLTAGEPTVHFFLTADGKRLQLTRYNGGDKGPLLFSHGLGVSSLIFRIDTIDTNLLEYMHGRGYDCWLLDFRASIDLPYAREQWTADECAKHDYQPAVDLIRAETGAASVQVIAHCFGATTFTMAMLGGHLAGVRSAVISQISADVIVPWFPQRLLAHLRAPTWFSLLGIKAVNARATTEQGLANRLLDALIRIAVPFQREERSRNATSNRITALYGQLYETDQLNATTFESGLPEMFGEANIAAFKHLALIARRTTLVDARGRDAYMPHLERMAIPICFIHGAENACFRPESTARTVTKLSARNGAELYARHMIADYGHIDCIFGKTAATDVYPHILAHLEKTALS